MWSLQDFRFASRLLSKTPVTTTVAVLSLALGIGANTAIFSLINALMIRPLPVSSPGRLVALETTGSSTHDGKDSLSVAMFEGIERDQRVFSSLFLWDGGGVENLEASGATYVGTINMVSGDYFHALGVKPLLGRMIDSSDVNLRVALGKVAVIGYGCWKARFFGDPQVLGKTIRVNGHPLTIIGVAPNYFHGMLIDVDADAFVPNGYSASGKPLDTESTNFQVVGRLKSGITLSQARAQLATIWSKVRESSLPVSYQGAQRQEFLKRQLLVERGDTGVSWLRTRMTRPLAVLMGFVAMVLLIACFNLANLMLARIAARRQELAIREALGSGRWRLVRLLLTESLTLCLAGAALGLVFAVWVARALTRAAMVGYISPAISPAPDFRVLAFTVTVALVTAVLFGTAPIWRFRRSELATVLARNTRSVPGRTSRLARFLISLQVALSLVLVMGAFLFARSLGNLYRNDPGFSRDGAIVIQTFTKPGITKLTNRSVYFHDLADKLTAIPGVKSVSYSYMGPVSPYESKQNVVSRTRTSGKATFELAGPGLFDVLRMRVLAGRQFLWTDNENAKRVVIVSQSLANHLFPSGSAVGQHVKIGIQPQHQDLEIVGVVNSASLWVTQNPEPLAFYLPLLQETDYDEPVVDLQVNPRVAGDLTPSMSAARLVLESMGRQNALSVDSLDQRFNKIHVSERLIATLSAFLGILSLLLAAIGIYGLVSYTVTSQTAEIGTRIALGAQRGDVHWIILRQVIGMATLGVAMGIPAAALISKFAAGMLFDLPANDPTTIALAVGVLVVTALLAGYLPARRAARLDPMEALRSE